MSKPKAIAKRLGCEDYPEGLSVTEMREMTLRIAGFDPEEVGRFVRKAASKLEAMLEAKTTKFFTTEGKVTDSREIEDNTSQIKAAAELLDLGIDVMALKRSSGVEGNSASKGPVVVDLSNWNVTVAEKKPIEQENT